MNTPKELATIVFVSGLTLGLIISSSPVSSALTKKTNDHPLLIAHEPNSHLNLNPGSASSKAAVLFQGNLIADIAEKAAPAVVKLEVDKQTKINSSSGQVPQIPMPGFGTFDFFFGGKNPNFLKILPHGNHNSGSGFIVRSDGYIVTNAHVVKDATKIEVRLNNKELHPAKIVGKDTFSDLAVIKIEAKNLPTLKLGSSNNLRPGEFVIAIGSPLGYDQSVTLGIISAVERSVTDINGNINFIQTDAAINRGNSGGPLINLNGEVIGVNTALRGDGQNIGFSIPADVAKSVTDDLIENRKILRPYLGIGMQVLSPTLLKSLGLPEDSKGIYVPKVYQSSPAEAAGIKRGDLIKKIEGQEMNSPKDVQLAVKSHKVGDTINFYVLRDGQGKAFSVKIGEYPDQSEL